VETVYHYTRSHHLNLVVSLHSPGGRLAEVNALLKATARHPDIIVCSDETYADFSLLQPFNKYLVQAAKTNPIEVNFMADEEVTGLDVIPGSNLKALAAHVEEARGLRTVYAHARVSNFSIHVYNTLASRRHFYPALMGTTSSSPIPPDLDVPSIDTLNGFNAEFLCRRVHDPAVSPEAVLYDFLTREFGPSASALVPTFMRLEGAVGKILYADTNYFSYPGLDPTAAKGSFGLDAHLTCPTGSAFPTPELLTRTGWTDFNNGGWPVALGHKCSGPGAMIRDKEEGLAEANQMLAEVEKVSQRLKPEDRTFLARQFEDLVLWARAMRYQLEAMANYYLTKAGKELDGMPDPVRQKAALAEMHRVAEEWKARYPDDRADLAKTLLIWEKQVASR